MKTNKKELELCWVTLSSLERYEKASREGERAKSINSQFLVSRNGSSCLVWSAENPIRESLLQLIPLESQAHCDSVLLNWSRKAGYENPRLIDFLRSFRAAFAGEKRVVSLSETVLQSFSHKDRITGRGAVKKPRWSNGSRKFPIRAPKKIIPFGHFSYVHWRRQTIGYCWPDTTDVGETSVLHLVTWTRRVAFACILCFFQLFRRQFPSSPRFCRLMRLVNVVCACSQLWLMTHPPVIRFAIYSWKANRFKIELLSIGRRESMLILLRDVFVLWYDEWRRKNTAR